MLWQECKKMWKRPVILASLLAICVLQFAEVWKNSQPMDAGAVKSFQKYSGIMDEDWKKRIAEEWERGEEDDAVLRWAYSCTDFQGMVQQCAASLQEMIAARDPDYDLERVERAYGELMRAEGLHFASQKAFFNYLANLTYVKYCVILFLILLCTPLFRGETEMGMDELLAICKRGRKELFLRKFFACQLSSLIVWLMVTLSAALAVGARIGWDGLDGFVQDFFLNACPFVWDERTYLCVVGIVGLAACQAASAVLFVIAYLAQSSVKSAIAAFVILFLPAVSGGLFQVMWLLLPNFLAGDYLWSSYKELRIGSWYMAEWNIAIAEIAVILSAVWIWCLRWSYRVRDC